MERVVAGMFRQLERGGQLFVVLHHHPADDLQVLGLFAETGDGQGVAEDVALPLDGVGGRDLQGGGLNTDIVALPGPHQQLMG